MTTETILPGLGIGGITGGAIILAEAVLSGNTHVPIQNAIGIGVAACGLVFWLGKKFQRIDDKQEEVGKTITEMDRKISGLYCVRNKDRDDCSHK